MFHHKSRTLGRYFSHLVGLFAALCLVGGLALFVGLSPALVLVAGLAALLGHRLALPPRLVLALLPRHLPALLFRGPLKVLEIQKDGT